MATTRRQFLRASTLAALGMGTLGGRAASGATRSPCDERRAQPSARKPGDPVLVTINLLGGNDVLNTVVPLGQYDRYVELRPELGIPMERLLPLPGYEMDFAFNPGMGAFVDLFREDALAVVNGVGLPADATGLFNHESCQRNFQTGDTKGIASALGSGWLGRYLDTLEQGSLPAGIDFGTGSIVVRGRQFEPLSLKSIDEFRIAPDVDVALSDVYRSIQNVPVASGVVEEDSRCHRLQLLELSDRLQALRAEYRVARGIQYPATGLARSLLDSAALIWGEPKLRAISLAVGGFDTHNGQNRRIPTEPLGSHDRLLRDVSEAVAAFYHDVLCHGLGDNVVVLILSEFGRRAAQNSLLGTDHGFGSLMFVVGNSVAGGVYGDYPDLDALVLDGNLDVYVDFRSVYATILDGHFGADDEDLLNGRFPRIGFLLK